MPEQMVKELSFSGIANKVASSIYNKNKLEFSFANMHESQDRSAGKGGVVISLIPLYYFHPLQTRRQTLAERLLQGAHIDT